MRGVTEDPYFGGTYIFASANNIDINGNVVGQYNLKLQGVDNWYNRFLEKISH